MARQRKNNRRKLLAIFAEGDANAAQEGIEKLLSGEPDLDPGLAWLWDAFWVLNASRPSGGMGPSAISLSDIKAYCELYQIRTYREIQQLVYCVQSMDREYLSYTHGN